jgi:hypothetical protein
VPEKRVLVRHSLTYNAGRQAQPDLHCWFNRRRGRIRTEGYYSETLLDDNAVLQAQEYISRHEGCRLTDGRLVAKRSTP